MKPPRVVLVAVVLTGGACGVLPYLGQRTPPADTPATVAPEIEVERPAQYEVALQPAHQTETPTLIGTLRSRNHTIHLYAGRFTVEDADGQVLAHLVTEEDFAKLLPELFGDFRRMYADGQLIADARTHSDLSTGCFFSAQPEQANIVPDP